MDPNTAHQFTLINTNCAITTYAFSVPLAMLQAGVTGNKLNKTAATNLVRTNATWTALRYNVPVALSSSTHMTFICFKNAADSNNVFQNIPNIQLLRSNWRVLFINATRGQITVKCKTDANGQWSFDTVGPTRGLIHIRLMELIQLSDAQEEDDEADPPLNVHAPAPNPTTSPVKPTQAINDQAVPPQVAAQQVPGAQVETSILQSVNVQLKQLPRSERDVVVSKLIEALNKFKFDTN